MSNGPTTAQGITQLLLGAATVLVVLGVPIGLFVWGTEAERDFGGGLVGLLGFLLTTFGGLLLVFTAPQFVAPSIPTYVRGPLERSSVNLTTGSPNDGKYTTSTRSEWIPWVLTGLAMWGAGLVLFFVVA